MVQGSSAGGARLGAALGFLLVPLLGAASPSGRVSSVVAPAVVFEKNRHLYAVAIDGSRRTRLTKTPLPGRGATPALSPDGSTVAFARGDGIWAIQLNGARLRRLTRGDDLHPAWTRDGRTIYFVRFRPHRYISTTYGSIYAVSATGVGVRRITDTSANAHCHTNPAVSPDGRHIAFSDWNACEGGTASPRLRVVDTNGRPTKDLARLRRNGYYPNPEHSDPAWSPDGTRLAYRLQGHLAVAYRDGSGERRLIGNSTLIYEPPAWSRDGRWIAFVRGDDAGKSVLVLRPDGTKLRRVARTTNTDYSLAGWLPRVPN